MKFLLILLVMTHTHAQRMTLTELEMKMTDGIGCEENEHFSLNPSKAICCEDDSSDNPAMRLAPNVCLEPLMTIQKSAPSPRCICNKGFDLKSQSKITVKQLIVNIQERDADLVSVKPKKQGIGASNKLMQIDKKNMLWLKMELLSLLMFALEL